MGLNRERFIQEHIDSLCVPQEKKDKTIRTEQLGYEILDYIYGSINDIQDRFIEVPSDILHARISAVFLSHLLEGYDLLKYVSPESQSCDNNEAINSYVKDLPNLIKKFGYPEDKRVLGFVEKLTDQLIQAG